MDSKEQDIINFIRDNKQMPEANLILKLTTRFSINTSAARQAIELVKSEKSTTSAPDTFTYQKPGSNNRSSESTSREDFKFVKQNFQSESNSTSQKSSQPTRYELEKLLIKMKLDKESKKLKKIEVNDFLESKKSNLVTFEKCIDPNIDAETFKSLISLATKDRTHILYYMKIGLDMDRILVLMNEIDCDSKKVRKIVDKLAKENHPMWIKYQRKHHLYRAYCGKTEEIYKQNDPSIMSKLLSVFRGDDKSSSTSSSSKKSNDKTQKTTAQHSNSNASSTSGKTSKKINLSQLNSENELIGQIGIFEHDTNNDIYILKTTGSFKGKDKVSLRDVNKVKFEQLLNGKPLPAKISGKIDWVNLGDLFVVGARFAAK